MKRHFHSQQSRSRPKENKHVTPSSSSYSNNILQQRQQPPLHSRRMNSHSCTSRYYNKYLCGFIILGWLVSCLSNNYRLVFLSIDDTERQASNGNINGRNVHRLYLTTARTTTNSVVITPKPRLTSFLVVVVERSRQRPQSSLLQPPPPPPRPRPRPIEHVVAEFESPLAIEEKLMEKEADSNDIDDMNCYERYTEQDWQTRFHPICNSIHEFMHLQWNNDDGDDSPSSSITNLLSMYGTWRSAWLVNDNKDTSSKEKERLLVLKMLHLGKSYTKSSYEQHQWDALIMETLQSSPYTINTYGFCGQSVIVDYARRDGLFISMKIRNHVNNHRGNTVPWKRRLLMAKDLAFGLHDIHTKSIAHGDIKLVNAIIGFYKNKEYFQWNDFNFGIFLKPSKNKDNDACGGGVPVLSNDPIWRCPEEIISSSTDGEITIKEYDKCDIYMFGNVIYELITGQEPWYYNFADSNNDDNVKPIPNNNHMIINSREELRKLKTNGDDVKPIIPNSINTVLASTQYPIPMTQRRKQSKRDPYPSGVLTALLEAMNTCFVQNPNDRPSAYQLGIAFNSTFNHLLLFEQQQSISNENNNATTPDVLMADQIKRLFWFEDTDGA